MAAFPDARDRIPAGLPLTLVWSVVPGPVVQIPGPVAQNPGRIARIPEAMGPILGAVARIPEVGVGRRFEQLTLSGMAERKPPAPLVPQVRSFGVRFFGRVGSFSNEEWVSKF
jgi:hypothetical protein